MNKLDCNKRYLEKPAGIEPGVSFSLAVSYGQINIESDGKNGKSFLNTFKLPELLKVKMQPRHINNQGNKIIPFDVATCSACLDDILNSLNRRYHYPFTNCTSCGPRFSIIKQLPYDRVNTTMDNFKMCPTCQEEYEDPNNRRFHAQLNCCPKCGPSLKFIKNTGEEVICSDILEEVINQLKEGKIIAIKGLGGFHLACDAFNENTIALLRARKNRPHKPFTIMIKDMNLIKSLCEINHAEENILLSMKSPIVILKKKNRELLPNNISPHLNTIGIMLPYTPIHHLIFENGIKALVMTSANISSSPMQYDNNQAINKLNNIPDFFLVHNRDIYLPIEDSVVKVINDREMVVRRGRGYSPYSVNLEVKNEILALGSVEKGNFSLSQNGYGYLSSNLGDLNDYETYSNYLKAIEHYKNLVGVAPSIIAHDLQIEPSYKGEKYVPVQHHHAHMVSCMIEHGLFAQTIGVIFDGTGLGTDGTIWGGEILVGNRKEFTRVGSLKKVLIQGGNSAITDIWKIAYSYLYALDIDPNRWIRGIREEEKYVINQALKSKLNCYYSSSVGRLFDCVSVLLNLCNQATYQGQGAIELESILNPMIKEAYECKFILYDGIYEIEFQDIIKGLLKDLDSKMQKSDISTKFHNTIAAITIKLITEISDIYQINDIVLSGGVFENNYLLNHILSETKNSHLKIYYNQQIPINDGGISLGQLAIADALERECGNVYSDSRTNHHN